jgi:hypothetical protein
MSTPSSTFSIVAWQASRLHPERKVALPTLLALRALLRSATGTAPSPEPVAIPIAELPGLADIGGVACVPGAEGPIGVARVGRASYVGFRLDADELREIEVRVTDAGRLSLGPPDAA